MSWPPIPPFPTAIFTAVVLLMLAGLAAVFLPGPGPHVEAVVELMDADPAAWEFKKISTREGWKHERGMAISRPMHTHRWQLAGTPASWQGDKAINSAVERLLAASGARTLEIVSAE